MSNNGGIHFSFPLFSRTEISLLQESTSSQLLWSSAVQPHSSPFLLTTPCQGSRKFSTAGGPPAALSTCEREQPTLTYPVGQNQPAVDSDMPHGIFGLDELSNCEHAKQANCVGASIRQSQIIPTPVIQNEGVGTIHSTMSIMRTMEAFHPAATIWVLSPFRPPSKPPEPLLDVCISLSPTSSTCSSSKVNSRRPIIGTFKER